MVGKCILCADCQNVKVAQKKASFRDCIVNSAHLQANNFIIIVFWNLFPSENNIVNSAYLPANNLILFFFLESIKVLEPLKDTIVKEGAPLLLQCRISKPRVKPVWSKDGKPLKGGYRVETKHDGQIHYLSIKKSDLTDIGKYSVSFDEDDCVLEANVDVKGKCSLILNHQHIILYDYRNIYYIILCGCV